MTWGASYDFGVAKVYGMAQYGKNENKMGGYSVNDVTGTVGSGDTVKFGVGEGLEGYALTLGATAPLLGGTVYAQANYFDGESSEDIGSVVTHADKTTTNYLKSADMKRYGAAVGYSYPFSKRTFAYSFAAYSEGKLEVTGINDHKTVETKTKKGEFGVGLVHKF